MTAAWDEAADRLHEQWRDERDEWTAPAQRGVTAGTGWAPEAVGVLRRLLGPIPRCEDCNEPVDRLDYRDFDGHGPQCPAGDPSCTLRVCDAQADHSTCETEDDRATRDAVEREQALREQAAEWRAEDGL